MRDDLVSSMVSFLNSAILRPVHRSILFSNEIIVLDISYIPWNCATKICLEEKTREEYRPFRSQKQE